LDDDVRFCLLVDNFEWEVLEIGLHFCVFESPADETLSVKDSVVWVHRDLVLGGIADQAFVVREGHIRRRGPVTLVVGNDLNAIVLPDADASVKSQNQSALQNAQDEAGRETYE
jgi:hypothetical protein